MVDLISVVEAVYGVVITVVAVIVAGVAEGRQASLLASDSSVLEPIDNENPIGVGAPVRAVWRS
jgi:hypothetical protein